MTAMALRDIKIGKQIRSGGLDWDHVANLTAVADDLPPILVDGRTWRIIDGHHRREAWKRLGRTTIPIETYYGDDPVQAAFDANRVHGLPITLADRKARARTLVEAHPDWSDREIARRAGVDHKTVGALRPTGELPQSDTRSGQSAPPAVKLVERERVAEVAKAQPDLSVRQLAEEAGVSRHAAADTKARLSRGEAPVPPRLQAVPDVEPSPPTVEEVVKFIPEWKSGEAFTTDNATHTFGLFMHRVTAGRHDFAEFVRDADLSACPEAHREAAAAELRRVARLYERAATEVVSSPSRLRRAK